MRSLQVLTTMIALLGLVAACSSPRVMVARQQGFTPQLQSRQLYIVPFEAVMVPQEVTELLFDQFVDQLTGRGAELGVEFVILKQPLAQVAPDWLAERDYLVGELYAYVEDVGSSVTDIKSRTRLRLYQPGHKQATLELVLPVETFYENDYSNLTLERRKLAERVSAQLVEALLAELAES